MSATPDQVLAAHRLRNALQDIDESQFTTKGELNGLSALLRWTNRVIREADETAELRDTLTYRPNDR
jgi:hypothetical protein